MGPQHFILDLISSEWMSEVTTISIAFFSIIINELLKLLCLLNRNQVPILAFKLIVLAEYHEK